MSWRGFYASWLVLTRLPICTVARLLGNVKQETPLTIWLADEGSQSQSEKIGAVGATSMERERALGLWNGTDRRGRRRASWR